jgi:hypothetical protein
MTADSFSGSLQLDFGDWGRAGRIAITLSPITWRGITLPAGFMSDGASVPRALWWFMPPWGDRSTLAALFHDFVCEARPPLPGLETRAACDRLLYDALIDLCVARWRARLAWAGVRAASLWWRLG